MSSLLFFHLGYVRWGQHVPLALDVGHGGGDLEHELAQPPGVDVSPVEAAHVLAAVAVDKPDGNRNRVRLALALPDLVCRLLLEKKKYNARYRATSSLHLPSAYCPQTANCSRN